MHCVILSLLCDSVTTSVISLCLSASLRAINRVVRNEVFDDCLSQSRIVQFAATCVHVCWHMLSRSNLSAPLTLCWVL